MSINLIKKDNLEYLTAENISVPHGFTTRHGGVSTGVLSSMNLAIRLDEKEENIRQNYQILGDALGFSLSDLVMTRQIHSDIVRVVSRRDCQGCFIRDYPECDGLVTNEPGLALVVFTADCTPILLWDPVTGAVGAAHAGWKGTAADIAGKIVQAMVDAFGCDPQNIRAAIGPNIGACCFETDTDVPEAIITTFGEDAKAHIRTADSKYYVNLKEINALALHRRGVMNIEISQDCTMCNPERYWSHRYTKGNRGSQGAIIVCKEVGK